METLDFIVGLMADNTDALGFIPSTTINDRYLKRDLYILQVDLRGRPIGYLLHGPIKIGRAVVISQHVIDYDKRRLGFGYAAFSKFVDRCNRLGATSIKLRVANDLPAVRFWQSCGFTVRRVLTGGARRNRLISEMVLLLNVPLLSADNAD